MNADSTSRWRWWVKALLVILWVFFLAGGYIWAHNPLTANVLLGLGNTLLSIAIWLGVSWLGAGLGWRLLPGRLLAEEAPAARLALTTGIGLGALSILVWALGMLSLFQRWTAWLLVLILAILLQRELIAVLGEGRRVRLPQPANKLQRWFLIYGVAVLSLTFLVSLAPPTAYDSLVYHLTGPRLYLETGRIGHPLDNPYLGFPLLGQMQFALGMLLAGDGPAALFHYGYGLLSLTLVGALAWRAFGRDAAWFAGVILLSVPTLFTLMSQPYVDVTLLFYATAAFYAFYRWRESHAMGAAEIGWLVIVGFFSGFAGGVKYTAVLIPVALGLSILWVSRRDGITTMARRLAVVAAIAAALVLPWVVENWLTTGNPVYPFFFDDARYWDAWRGWWYDRPGTGLAATAPWRLLTAPLEASILGTEGSDFYDATLGPLVLIGGSLLVAVWTALQDKEKGVAGHMLFFFGLNYLFWLSGVARSALLLQTRLLFFILGVGSTLGGVALSRLSVLRSPQLDVNWLVRTVFAGTLGLMLFSQIRDFLAVNPLPVTIGMESRDEFLTRRLGHHHHAMQRLNQLPPESSVVFLWETRSYACQVECWPDALLDRFLHHTHYYRQDADEIAAAWREQGFTHVLLHQAGLDFIVEAGFDPVRPADLLILAQLQRMHLRQVAQWGDDYVLYRLKG